MVKRGFAVHHQILFFQHLTIIVKTVLKHKEVEKVPYLFCFISCNFNVPILDLLYDGTQFIVKQCVLNSSSLQYYIM